MTNKELKKKYHSEKGIRWYDNWADYANWLEDALIEALRQPPVMPSLPDANPHHCPECSWQCTCSDQPCSCCSGNEA